MGAPSFSGLNRTELGEEGGGGKSRLKRNAQRNVLVEG